MKSVTHLNLWVWIQHLLQCHGDTTRTPLRGHQEKGRGHQAAGKELTGRVSQEVGLGPQLMSWFLLWTGTKWHYNSISQWKARGHLLSTEKSVLYIPKAAWPRRLELKESWKEFNRGKKTSKIACLETVHRHFCCELGHRIGNEWEEEQWCHTIGNRVRGKCWGDASKEDAECNSRKMLPADSRKIISLVWKMEEILFEMQGSHLLVHGQQRLSPEEVQGETVSVRGVRALFGMERGKTSLGVLSKRPRRAGIVLCQHPCGTNPRERKDFWR